MKRQFFVFISILIFAAGLTAQKPQPVRVDPTEANLRRTIEYLASDQLEGRRTGEPGATLAAGYVANQFARLKLKPGARAKNGKPSYLQPYPYITGVGMVKNGNTAEWIVDRPDGTRGHINNGVAWPIGYSANGFIKDAPVVFAGYGITAKEANYDDYTWDGNPIDVKGAVVLVFDGYPDYDNPHSPFGRFDLRTKALIAKDHGAVGMFLISREENIVQDRHYGKLEYDQSLGETAVPMEVIGRGLTRSLLGVDEKSLATMEELTAKKKDGVNTHVGFRELHPRTTFDVQLTKEAVSAYNVIGVLPGTDPKLKNEAIVIGAHYDHLGHGGAGSLAANSTEIHHGADDNASGVAAIIELARLLGAKRDNKRTLIFIAFSGEEEGLFGSNFYVNNPIFPLDKTVAMVNLDMVGRLNEKKLTIGGIGTASEWKSLVEDANNRVPMTAEPEIVSAPNASGNGVTWPGRLTSMSGTSYGPAFSLQLNEDGFGPSDHSSFYGKKTPVLFFFTGTHNDYHKPSDTADKINYAGEHSIIHYIQSIIKAVDQNPQRPTYTVAKTTMQGGRTGFNISLGTIPNYADSTDGLLLDGVRDGSPADKAGVKAGDKVVKLAGHDIRNVMDYTYVLGEMKAGQEYEIELMRAGQRMTFKIVPVKR